jgi:VWFA-related protein
MAHQACGKAISIGLLLVSCAPALRGQEAKPPTPDAGHTISVQTEMVRVPAIVTDRSGAAITDLTVHDFVIVENGRPQPIAFFQHIQSKPELAKAVQLPDGAVTNRYEQGAGRLTIILLDMVNTSFADQERARRSISKFLAASVSSTEPVGLMTLNPDGVRVIHDFTTNPSVLADALKMAGGERSVAEMSQPVPLDPLGAKHATMTEAIRLREFEVQGQVGGFYGAVGVRLTLNSLREIGEAFAGIPGRKSLIWATGGLAFPVDDKFAMNPWLNGLTTMYQDTWQALNRADIAVYPLDVEGLVNPTYRHAAQTRRRNTFPTFQTTVYEMENFARMTGGRMCYVKTQIDGCMREAAADSADYYVLGFYPEPDPKRTGWRKMTVRVERNGASVQARSSYYMGSKRDINSGRREDVALGLASPLDYTDLPLTVRWTGNADTNGGKTVGFQFLLAPGVASVDETDGNHVDMEFGATAITSQGKVAGQFSKAMEGRLETATAKTLVATGGMFPGQMDLPPGDYQIRFVARDNLNGRMGSISTSLKVP